MEILDIAALRQTLVPLYIGIIGQAIVDMRSRDNNIRRAAEYWFYDNAWNVGPFSLTAVCFVLKLDIEYVRTTLRSGNANAALQQYARGLRRCMKLTNKVIYNDHTPVRGLADS
jgi:hypothetical protein